MNRQTQWLFEAPPILESASHPNQTFYSNPEWEGEWELQEATLYGLGEEEWERSPISSPRRQTIRETISGFSRYSNAIPPQERAKIARIAQMIVQSHKSGQPIRTVRLVGHADRDVQRGANFEKKISGDRAQFVKQALIDAINRQSSRITQISAIRSRGTTSAIASLIHWQIEAAGANQLVVHNPKTEQERLRNRRVQIVARRRPPSTPPRPKPAIEIVSPIPGTTFAISAVPGMPTINAQARIVGVTPDPTPTTTFEWRLQISLNAQTCPNGPNRIINAPREIVEKVVGGSFTPVFDFIRGGDLTLIVRAVVDGKTLEARTRGLKIQGTNPDRSVIQAILPRMLAQMACQESGQRQFNAPTDGGISPCPLFSSDRLGGVGLFQLTNPPPGPDMFWDWRTNAAAAQVLLDQKRAFARGYPGRVRRSRGFRQLVQQFNQARRRSGLPELTITLPNFTEGDFNTPGQLELDAIRGFNGFAGRDRFGLELHEFRVAVDPRGLLRVIGIDDVAQTGEAVWEGVPSADRPPGTGDPRYVERVLGARC